jgi:hypothetical protein
MKNVSPEFAHEQLELMKLEYHNTTITEFIKKYQIGTWRATFMFGKKEKQKTRDPEKYREYGIQWRKNKQ